MFKSLLLQVSSYPEATPASAIGQAVTYAKLLDSRLTLLTFENEIPAPQNVLANAIIDVGGMVAAERERSRSNVQTQLKLLREEAGADNVEHDELVERCMTSEMPEITVGRARTHDLTLIPVDGADSFQNYIAECVIFGAGRPVLLVPVVPAPMNKPRLEAVGIAWDFSRPAARAVADAMPILMQADIVRIVIVTNDKPTDASHSVEALVDNLAAHGIDAIVDEVPARGRPVGEALEHYAHGHFLNLLVMGAYGHSRFRDFLLGGATKSVVANPPLPVFLSH